jgi:hypothetical protein
MPREQGRADRCDPAGLGGGPADSRAGPGPAARQRPGDLRRPPAGRSTRPAHRPTRSPPRTPPLPRGTDPQAGACQAPQHSNKPAPRRELVSTTSGENTPRLLGSVATEQQDKDYRMRRVRTASSVTDDLTAPTILQDRVFLSFVTGKGQGNLNTSGWTARTVSTSVTTRNAPRSDSPPDRRSRTRTGRSSSKPAWCQIPTFALKYDPVLKQL